jgi:hypothetical protein
MISTLAKPPANALGQGHSPQPQASHGYGIRFAHFQKRSTQASEAENNHCEESKMKRSLTAMVIFLGVFCCAASSQAYFYAFEFIDGAVALSVNAEADELSMVTTDDLIVGFTYDAPSEDMLLSYTLSADLSLNLFGAFNYDIVMDDEPIGILPSIDPADYIGDGTSAMSFSGETSISGDFGELNLQDATLAYDILFTPSGVDDEYLISINALTLSDGNTAEFLAGIFDAFNIDGLPISLLQDLPVVLSGNAELSADPVPIPAAIWLLGSGLIGMVGLRRRSGRSID